MNVYKVSIDTSAPSRQVLTVPRDTPKYGVAVNVSNGKHSIRNLSAAILDGESETWANSKLNDGSLIVTLSSGPVESDREVKVHLSAEPVATGTSFDLPVAGFATIITPPLSV